MFSSWKVAPASLNGSSKYPGDDYDYVNLESKAKFDEENEEVKRSLPQDMKKAFDVLVRQSESLPVLPASDKVRILNWRHTLKVYVSLLHLPIIYFLLRCFFLVGNRFK